MANEFDILLFDLWDIGSRYYTFITTMVNCLLACSKFNKKIIILDRPNPIGFKCEGNYIADGYSSFVGALNIPNRHGLTMGELSYLAKDMLSIKVDLQVVKVTNWNRRGYYDAFCKIWISPSPNMPSLDTAIVYPGACLIEGTNLSEGRGTTTPF